MCSVSPWSPVRCHRHPTSLLDWKRRGVEVENWWLKGDFTYEPMVSLIGLGFERPGEKKFEKPGEFSVFDHISDWTYNWSKYDIHMKLGMETWEVFKTLIVDFWTCSHVLKGFMLFGMLGKVWFWSPFHSHLMFCMTGRLGIGISQ